VAYLAPGKEGQGELTPSPWENPEIFNLPHMIKFANFEFIFAIRGPKLVIRVVLDKLVKHKIGGSFILLAPLE